MRQPGAAPVPREPRDAAAATGSCLVGRGAGVRGPAGGLVATVGVQGILHSLLHEALLHPRLWARSTWEFVV